MNVSMAWLGRATTVLVLAAISACGDDGTDTDTAETGADDGTSTATPATGEETAADTAATAMAEDTGCAEPPQLYLVNGTGNAVEEITMLACDMSEQSSYPVPGGGLPDATELTIDLPGPGCWLLGYSGEGCFSDMPVMVEAACGETAEWALLPENHVCAGG